MSTFDPLNPQNGQVADADLLRNQFNALKGLIDTVPVGPKGDPGNDGAPGPQGPAGVATWGLNYRGSFGLDVLYQPGDVVTYLAQAYLCPVNLSGYPTPDIDTRWLPLSLIGPPGPTGRSVVGVSDDGLGHAVIQMSDGASYGPFTVANGPQGNTGNDGAPGPQGPQGPAGEVTAAALASAIADCAQNPATVTNLTLTVSDSPTQSELQAVVDKLNELITALRR